MEKKVFFNTTLPQDLLKEFKILAIEQNRRLNELLAEAIRDIIEKYKSS